MQGNGHLQQSVEQAIERQVAFGELLNQQEKAQFLDYGVVRSAAPGEFLCRPHQIDTRSYILAIGEVEIRDSTEEKGAVLARLGRSELFGEISALFHLPRISAVRVSRPSVLVEIPGDILEKVISSRPELYDAVVQRYKQRITDTALRSVALFRYIATDRLAALNDCSSVVGIPPGEAIVREGEPGEAIYVIIYGTARVTHQVDGESRDLALLRTGDYLGEWAVLTGAPRTATVTAVTRVEAIRIDYLPFLQFIRENPQIADPIKTLAFSRYSAATDQWEVADARAALEQLLLRIKKPGGHPDE